MTDVVTYAKKNNLFLFVTINEKNGSSRSLKMTPLEFRKSLRKHKTFYDAVQTSYVYDDYETVVSLSDGTKFVAILY